PTLRLRKLWKFRAGILGLAIVAGVSALAIFAEAVSPYDPYDQKVARRLTPPVWAERGSSLHVLGTDPVGRDVLSRLIFGSRVSLATGVVSVLIAAVIGIVLGLLGGYYGGTVDSVINNLVNVMMAFPFMLLALTAIAVMGPSFRNLVIVLGITGWPIYTRVVRAETYHLKGLEFVTAARAMGFPGLSIVAKHIFPNLVNTIIVTSSLEVARMIIQESFLSFLSLGVQPPTPSWGGMLGEGRMYMLTHPWLATFPGLAIFATTLGINLLGDGLRDLLDPHRY
ncbi:MAG TPA: ABC transporter permease, partial [Candidatus Methylomirabilis sp.]|nr:ABC transporter permease [Candidatus Methylomirabilis sp.]